MNILRRMNDPTLHLLMMAVPVVTAISAFIRHCWWSLSLLMSDAPLTAGKALLAGIGIFMPPIGMLHGIWLWVH